MAKLFKSERDAIRAEVRAEREPFRPSSQNRNMDPNLEQIYRDHASAGKVDARAYVSRRLMKPLDHDVVETTGI